MAESSTSQSKRYSDVLSNDGLFGNAMYALSQIHFNRTSGRDSYAYHVAEPHNQKHVNLLECIALILVYDSQGDVVATALGRENDSYTIYWAKNQTITLNNREAEYLTKLQQSFQQASAPSQTLDIVIPMCRKKIHNRVKKLAIELSREGVDPSNPFNLDWKDPKAETLRQLLSNQDVIDDPLEDVLRAFAQDAKEMSKNSTYTVGKIKHFIYIAYWLSLNPFRITQKLTLGQVADADPDRFRKVMKIGSYYYSCLNIHNVLDDQPRRDNFRLELVPAPEKTKFYVVHKNTLEALNTWTLRYQLSTIDDFSDLKNIYKSAKPGEQSGTFYMKTSQHCELTLGLFLWKRKRRLELKGPLEIGCSKAMCHYCAKYIEEFNEWANGQPPTDRINQIMTKGTHGKCILGWAMPDGPAEVRKQVLDDIGTMMSDIVHKFVGPRRKSDSHSPPSHNVHRKTPAQELAIAKDSSFRPYKGSQH
ncbi:MAG: hypothetical protein Q9166_003385 [cf. Caloplaca sp. 2 TL-2023]